MTAKSAAHAADAADAADAAHAVLSASLQDRQTQHWRRNKRLVGWMLLLWVAVTFLGIWFARDLNFRILGWPFSFWVVAQGAPVVYVLLVWRYAWAMHRLDRDCGLAEEE